MTAVHLAGQAPSLTLLTREGRRGIALATANGQEMVALDDLAAIFQLTIREESGSITITHSGRTIVVTPDQTMASVAGRVISLPSPPARIGGRWYVPVDFINRAIAPIHDSRVELRRGARLLLVGDVRVPRVTIRHEALANGGRIAIEIAPRANVAVTQDSPSHLIVKVDADAIDPTLPAGALAGLVVSYRSIDATSIGIDLGPRVTTFRSTTQTQDTVTRLTIDVLPATDTAPAPPTTTQAEPAPPELPVLTGPSGWLRTVAIDAGHGGDDAGAKGSGGTVEKALTLSVARRVKATIEARLGLRVIMTRDDDRLIAVTDRTAMANNNKADLFISLHANASFRPTVSGAVIYVASFDEASVAAIPNAPERLPAFGGGFRDLELVPWNLAQVRYRDQSEAFANLVAEQFKEHVPLAARAVDRAPLRVLESANMAAVLVEMGYLTNKAQEAQLNNSELQGAIAQGIVDAIVRFRDVAAQSEGAVR
jgi:N-acetylmuramoyl-L-alanine amidase